jgi:3',5'-cyclic AMP phosphodiesterase CpdA
MPLRAGETVLFRKKRLALLAVLAAAVVAGWWLGPWVAVAGLGLFVVLLGGLQLVHRATAHGGLDQIEALSGRFHYPALAAKARERAGDTGVFSFVVLGDSRNNRKTAASCYRRASEEHPAFILHTGDIVRHGTAREFLHNHVSLLDLTDGAPVIPVPGNHDRGARRDFATFRALYGDERFSFEADGCRFVGINNSGKDRVTAEDLAWLDSELAAPARHKFVILHIPPAYFEEQFANDQRRRGFKERADAFRTLMAHHGVTEVFTSHIHGFATADIDGVRHTLTAGAGAPLSTRLDKAGQAHHFVLVHVTPGGITREVVRKVPVGWEKQPV